MKKTTKICKRSHLKGKNSDHNNVIFGKLLVLSLIALMFPLLVQGANSNNGWGAQKTIDTRIASNVNADSADLGWGDSSPSQIRDFLNNNHAYRIRQNADVTKVKIYIGNVNFVNLDTFKIKIWRWNGSAWDKVNETANLSGSLLANQVNTLTLNTPIAVQEGDYVGYTIISGAGGDWMGLRATNDMGANSTYYITGSEAANLNHDWTGDTVTTSLVKIELFTDLAPNVIAVGDSITAGHPGNYSFIESTNTTSLSNNAWYHLNSSRGVVWQNMGIGGNKSQDVLSRFTNDVINLNPNYVIIAVGVNDLMASVSQNTYINNMTSILDACNANNIKPIVVKILPWTNGTVENLQTRDTWMTALKTLTLSYNNAIWVDIDSSLGQFRSGGDAGNLWDIKPSYSSDGVHLNASGYAVMGYAIDAALIGKRVTSNNQSIKYNDCSNCDARKQVGVYVNSGVIGLNLYNITISNSHFGIYNKGIISRLINSIIGWGSNAGDDLFQDGGTVISNSSNIIQDGDDPDGGGDTITLNPLFANATNNNFTLKSTSPAIDSGETSLGLSADYVGNPIYGIPDTGAYEYQPPYIIGINNIPTTGSIRIYSDGKYRMKTATSTSATISFSVTPQGGSYQATTTQFMDITIDKWETTGNKNKEWTATSTVGAFQTHATTTIYTIGDLLSNTYYQFKIDGTASTTAVTGATCNSNGSCLSNSNGQIIFNYIGGYSTHIFALDKDITGPNSFNLVTTDNTKVSTTQPTLTWNATIDPSSTLSKYQLYVDGLLDTDNIPSSATSIIPTKTLTCGDHTWYVKAVDNNGNETNTNAHIVGMVCDAGIFAGSLSLSKELKPRLQTVYPDGAVVYHNNKSKVDIGKAQIDSKNLLTYSKIDGKQVKEKQIQIVTMIHSFTKTQSKGFKGIEATNLQQMLRKLNFFTYSKNTGYYGEITETAVKQFQCKYNIVCIGEPQTTGYGVVGPKTRKALNKVSRLQANTDRKEESTKKESLQVIRLQQQINDLFKRVEMLKKQLLSI